MTNRSINPRAAVTRKGKPMAKSSAEAMRVAKAVGVMTPLEQRRTALVILGYKDSHVKGRNPERPPGAWIDHVKPQFRDQFPTLAAMRRNRPGGTCGKEKNYDQAITCIIAGVWHNFNQKTKVKLAKRFENPRGKRMTTTTKNPKLDANGTGASQNPRGKKMAKNVERFVVSSEGMARGFHKLVDTQSGQTIRTSTTRSVLQSAADELNVSGLPGISGQVKNPAMINPGGDVTTTIETNPTDKWYSQLIKAVAKLGNNTFKLNWSKAKRLRAEGVSPAQAAPQVSHARANPVETNPVIELVKNPKEEVFSRQATKSSADKLAKQERAKGFKVRVVRHPGTKKFASAALDGSSGTVGRKPHYIIYRSGSGNRNPANQDTAFAPNAPDGSLVFDPKASPGRFDKFVRAGDPAIPDGGERIENILGRTVLRKGRGQLTEEEMKAVQANNPRDTGPRNQGNLDPLEESPEELELILIEASRINITQNPTQRNPKRAAAATVRKVRKYLQLIDQHRQLAQKSRGPGGEKFKQQSVTKRQQAQRVLDKIPGGLRSVNRIDALINRNPTLSQVEQADKSNARMNVPPAIDTGREHVTNVLGRTVLRGRNPKQTVTVKGVKYNVVDRFTIKRLRQEGKTNLAKELEKHGIKAQLGLKRPGGNVTFMANERKDGKIDGLQRVGRNPGDGEPIVTRGKTDRGPRSSHAFPGDSAGFADQQPTDFGPTSGKDRDVAGNPSDGTPKLTRKKTDRGPRSSHLFPGDSAGFADQQPTDLSHPSGRDRDVAANPKKNDPLEMQCQECKKEFKKRIGPRTFEVKCPKCGSFDTDIAGSKGALRARGEEARRDFHERNPKYNPLLSSRDTERDETARSSRFRPGDSAGFAGTDSGGSEFAPGQDNTNVHPHPRRRLSDDVGPAPNAAVGNPDPLTTSQRKVLDDFNRSGRTATLYPKSKKIAISGGKRLGIAAAVSKMNSALARKNPVAPEAEFQCPGCAAPFNIEQGQSEGFCPSCHAGIRVLDDSGALPG